MIVRILEDKLTNLLGSGKAITIMGARQVGKSTLLQQLFSERNDVMWFNGDDMDIRDMFASMTSTRIKAFLGNKKILVVDEAQRIPSIGLFMKMIVDQIGDVQVIATGSSSFELSNKLNEPLTGRKREFKLYPLTFQELVNHTSLLNEMRMVPHRLVYGYYPEVVNSPGEEKKILKELSDSYLYRDILSIDRVKNADSLARLLKALALQIGGQVSYNELSGLVGINAKTVERYIDILEKGFVVFRLNSFARNLRNELKACRKIYFWDMGIRNAIIGNFSQVENRTDVGEMWENFVISERMKKLSYANSFANTYFWRTKQQQEIDFLQEEDGQIQTFEFKWNEKKAGVKVPTVFANAYPDVPFKVITPKNVDEFLL